MTEQDSHNIQSAQNTDQQKPNPKTVPLRPNSPPDKNTNPPTSSNSEPPDRNFASELLQLELAKKDYDRVSQETIQKRNCRGTIFLATLTAMSTAAFALIAFANNATPDWLWLGALIPLMMLTISILASIQKARAINLRIGYLAALSSCLATGRITKFFAGWENALRSIGLCNVALHRNTNEPPCLRPHWEQCKEIARCLSQDEHKFVQMWRMYFLKSFTTFTGVIYAVLFLGWSVAFIWLSAIHFKYPNRPFFSGIILAALIISAIFLTSYGLLRTSRRARIIAEQKKIYQAHPYSKNPKKPIDISYEINIAVTQLSVILHSLCNIFLILSFFALFIAILCNYIQPKWASPAIIISLLIFLLAVAISLYLAFYALRKGENSIEFFSNLWRTMLMTCPWMSGRKIWREQDTPGLGRYACCNCDKVQPLHEGGCLKHCACNTEYNNLFYNAETAFSI